MLILQEPRCGVLDAGVECAPQVQRLGHPNQYRRLIGLVYLIIFISRYLGNNVLSKLIKEVFNIPKVFRYSFLLGLKRPFHLVDNQHRVAEDINGLHSEFPCQVKTGY